MIPTIEVFKGDKRVIINKSDLRAWQMDGWDVALPEKPKEPEAEPEKPVKKATQK